MRENILKKRIARIAEVMDIAKLASMEPASFEVKKYYTLNKYSYTFGLNAKYTHMGISKDQEFQQSDFLGALLMIGRQIEKLKTKDVLELGSGRGANLAYLADQNKDCRFTGVDISKTQLQFSRRLCNRHSNISILEQDYHDLSAFSKNSFGLVFSIEAFCYCRQKPAVFRQINRILRPDGIFIVFDGYRMKKESELEKTEKLGFILAERGMALPNGDSYSEFKRLGESNGLKVIFEKDLTKDIKPTLNKLEKHASWFFRYPWLGRILVRIIPREVYANAVSAYLMPVLGDLGAGKYCVTMFQKE